MFKFVEVIFVVIALLLAIYTVAYANDTPPLPTPRPNLYGVITDHGKNVLVVGPMFGQSVSDCEYIIYNMMNDNIYGDIGFCDYFSVKPKLN